MANALAESGDGRDSAAPIGPVKRAEEEGETKAPPTGDKVPKSRLTAKPEAGDTGHQKGKIQDDGTVKFADGIRSEPAAHRPSTMTLALALAQDPDQDRSDKVKRDQVQGETKAPQAQVEVPWRTAKPPGP